MIEWIILFFGIPPNGIKEFQGNSQNNTLLLVYQKIIKWKIENNIVNWQVRAVGTYTQIKMWIYQQTRLVRLIAKRTIILDDYCLTPNNLDQLWNATTGSAVRIIIVKNNKNIIEFGQERFHALHWISVTKQRM